MKVLENLYSPHQSPMKWWNTIDDHLLGVGSERVKSDPCVYNYPESGALYLLTMYLCRGRYPAHKQRSGDEADQAEGGELFL